MGTENSKIKIFRKENIAYVIIVLGIFTLAPFFLISQYNHPSSDDFSLGIKQKELIPSVVKAYNNRNGRYFQTIMVRINPLRYRSFQMYKVLPVIMMCLFVIAITSLIYSLLWKYYTLKHIIALSFFLIFLFILQMPSTSEGFFWFSAYITYLLPAILTLFLIVSLMKAISTNNNFSRIVLLIVSSIFCVAIIGSNEISFLIIDLIILFMYINHILVLKRHNRILLFLLIVCVISSIIEILAPGNYIRFATFDYSSSFTWTIFGSLFLTVYSFIRWGILILLASIFYSIYFGIPLSTKIAAAKVKLNIDLRLSVIFFLAFIYLSNIIIVWSTGSSPFAAKRSLNIIYLFFVLGWFFNLQLFLNKHIRIFKFEKTKISQLLLFTSILLLLLMPFNLNYNISTAYIDLFSGKASKYDNELKNRYQLINSCKMDSCAVPALTDIPKTIFFRDIKEGCLETDYNNKLYSKYFDKSYIFLNSSNPNINSNQETLKEYGKNERKKWFETQKKNVTF